MIYSLASTSKFLFFTIFTYPGSHIDLVVLWQAIFFSTVKHSRITLELISKNCIWGPHPLDCFAFSVTDTWSLFISNFICVSSCTKNNVGSFAELLAGIKFWSPDPFAEFSQIFFIGIPVAKIFGPIKAFTLVCLRSLFQFSFHHSRKFLFS